MRSRPQPALVLSTSSSDEVVLHGYLCHNSIMTFFNDYIRGLEVLEFVSPKLGRFARALGTPVSSDAVPRAAVSFNGDLDNIEFHLNEDYVSELTDTEIAAVLAHASKHVILNHLKERYDKLFANDRYIIEAHECIINDQIPMKYGIDLPEDTFAGPDVFGENFAHLTSAEGYEIVKNFYENQDESQDYDSDESDDSQEAGQGPSEPTDNTDGGDDAGEPIACDGFEVSGEDAQAAKDAVSKAIAVAFDGDDPEEIERELGADARDAIEDAMDDASSSVPGGTQYSVGTGGGPSVNAERYFGSQVIMNWAKLLEKIDPKILSRGKTQRITNWTRSHPAMASVYPDVILPSRRRVGGTGRKGKNAKPAVILALDFSGSIPASILGTLVKLAESLPADRVTPEVITWSDDIQVYDERKRTVARMGTNFNKMIQWVKDYERENNLQAYVICVSDGQFRSWIDYTDSRFHYVKIGRNDPMHHHNFSHVYDLADFTS